MKKTKSNLCPYCKQPIIGYPAISRVDNKTEICSHCGVAEALKVFVMAQRKEVRKSGSKTTRPATNS